MGKKVLAQNYYLESDLEKAGVLARTTNKKRSEVLREALTEYLDKRSELIYDPGANIMLSNYIWEKVYKKAEELECSVDTYIADLVAREVSESGPIMFTPRNNLQEDILKKEVEKNWNSDYTAMMNSIVDYYLINHGIDQSSLNEQEKKYIDILS